MASVPVIITRAEPGAGETATRLEALGLHVIQAPMLSLNVRTDVPLEPVQNFAGLVFTSANGVRVFAKREKDRSLTAWCVGPATAEAARLAGFSNVRESAGNAEDLAKFIADHSTPTEQPLLHVANTAATGTLQSVLQSFGFSVRFAGLYDMQPSVQLPDRVQTLIQAQAPAILLIHSNKGATAIANLLSEQNCENLIAVGISDQALTPLNTLNLCAVHFAEVPNEDGLIAALTAAIATLSA
ncbi:MAG: uroporphyrinogen-III synthase [Pseudomonadota bacterium]